MFQSSFELTGYITKMIEAHERGVIEFQSSFELTGYITRRTRKIRGIQHL